MHGYSKPGKLADWLGIKLIFDIHLRYHDSILNPNLYRHEKNIVNFRFVRYDHFLK